MVPDTLWGGGHPSSMFPTSWSTDDSMPIYEYHCKSCGHQMEAFQKLSDDPLKVCPACHDVTLSKLISAAGFRLKGGGWYETDFKGAKDTKRNLAGGESKADTTTASPAPASSKPPPASSSD